MPANFVWEGCEEYVVKQMPMGSTGRFISDYPTVASEIETEKLLNRVDPKALYHVPLLDTSVCVKKKETDSVVDVKYSYPIAQTNVTRIEQSPVIKKDIFKDKYVINTYVCSCIYPSAGIHMDDFIIEQRKSKEGDMVSKYKFFCNLYDRLVEDYLQLIFEVAHFHAKIGFVNRAYKEKHGHWFAAYFMVLQHRAIKENVYYNKTTNKLNIVEWGDSRFMDYNLFDINGLTGLLSENYNEYIKPGDIYHISPDFVSFIELLKEAMPDKSDKQITEMYHLHRIKTVYRFTDLYKSIEHMLKFMRAFESKIDRASIYMGSDQYEEDDDGFPAKIVPEFEFIRKDGFPFNDLKNLITNIMNVRDALNPKFLYNENKWALIKIADRELLKKIEEQKTWNEKNK